MYFLLAGMKASFSKRLIRNARAFLRVLQGRDKPHNRQNFRGVVRLKNPEESLSQMGSEL